MLAFAINPLVTAWLGGGCTAFDCGAAAPPRRLSPRMWVGETSTDIEIHDVPLHVLYKEYADLSRMTEWSPSLESVTVDPDEPSQSVWVMRVPGALRAASRAVGYPSPNIAWEAVLNAQGPPSMSWTSLIREDDAAPDCGAEATVPMTSRAGFVPSGSVTFRPLGGDASGGCVMTLTLIYELPDPVDWWMLALINSALVQGIVRNRMKAGMQRFARAMRAEHQEQLTHVGGTQLGAEH